MTVAAIILAASRDSALAPADGLPRVRRLADAAWAGGALPIVCVAPDPEGDVGRSLAGSAALLAAPAPFEGGPVGQIVRGITVAQAQVSETGAALIWPARLCWVDPETLTSLIELHGRDGEVLLRPTYHGEPGWPVLLPLGHLDRMRGLAPDRAPDELIADLEAAGVPIRLVELGDPGTVLDGSRDRVSLPPYEGPPEPIGHAHEWGSPAADRTDDLRPIP